MKKVALSILMAGLLAGCASNQPPAEQSGQGTEAAATAPEAVPVTEPVSADPLHDPNSPLAKRSVYYPLDVSVVQEVDRPVVAAHAEYLVAHPDIHVRLEGNCDERGSTEYNLALGQRRADGVKKLLLVGGVRLYGQAVPNLPCREMLEREPPYRPGLRQPVSDEAARTAADLQPAGLHAGQGRAVFR